MAGTQPIGDQELDGLAEQLVSGVAKEALDLVSRSLALLRDGKPARLLEHKPEEDRAFRSRHDAPRTPWAAGLEAGSYDQ